LPTEEDDDAPILDVTREHGTNFSALLMVVESVASLKGATSQLLVAQVFALPMVVVVAVL
jgi:hypothetical protein